MPSEIRKIVHIDMDAFYASVEQRDRPELRGQPVVVAWTGARSVVCAASYEARHFGVHSAMAVSRAQRLCPDAVYVPPDFNRYRAVSRQVREIFSRHTDLIEPLSLDEAYLDVTVNKLGLPSATAVAEAIRAQIQRETGLTASAGVAPNKFLAKIASDWNKPDGLFVLRPAKVLEFLQPLPVRKVPGVGRVTQARLESLGIHTVGDLATCAPAELEHHFGRHGLRLHELARGLDEREVQPDQPLQQVSAENTFERDLRLADLGEALDRLAARVWEQARKKGQLGRTAVLKLKTDRFRLLTRSLTLSQPPSSAEELAAIARRLCARVDLPAHTRYRLAGVGMSNFTDPAQSARQPDLFGGAF
ncbi:DNA polymerase IV [Bordetella avium]|uniref:DNA polymerase IV n=1 Tax=Bordetella avium TaxID=521 RepID=UPI000E0C1D4A|nr:DNA polymerase IV [Bordetella avium]RIQ12836.1 DNA polymerase IV [Bordetella avium]RIQ38013.1 DNA polymerase IV [Bordetella avium]RIQ41840.1 DNA polymerase IV [Bordetella avium]RIQ43483.1 DNA polymerase IV [Bordetella avium]RIQ48661.1 DNA polymerase IV [Bordetella avium]